MTAPGAGVFSRVKVFDGTTGVQIIQFEAFELSYTGGVRVAAGDGDGNDEAIVGLPPNVGNGAIRVGALSGSLAPAPGRGIGGLGEAD